DVDACRSHRTRDGGVIRLVSRYEPGTLVVIRGLTRGNGHSAARLDRQGRGGAADGPRQIETKEATVELGRQEDPAGRPREVSVGELEHYELGGCVGRRVRVVVMECVGTKVASVHLEG